MEEYQVKARGRPKDSERRGRILQAAEDLFLEHGVVAVSVDAIAREAEVSNRTVYSHFADKEALLWAVIQNAGDSIRPQLTSSRPATKQEFRDSLIDFGSALVRLLTDPKIVALGKLILSESSRHPEMAKQFYEWGPRQTREQLRLLIQTGIDRRFLRSNTPPNCSDHLLAMWQGTWHLPQQLGLQSPLSKTKAKQHSTECVELFLQAYGA